MEEEPPFNIHENVITVQHGGAPWSWAAWSPSLPKWIQIATGWASEARNASVNVRLENGDEGPWLITLLSLPCPELGRSDGTLGYLRG